MGELCQDLMIRTLRKGALGRNSGTMFKFLQNHESGAFSVGQGEAGSGGLVTLNLEKDYRGGGGAGGGSMAVTYSYWGGILGVGRATPGESRDDFRRGGGIQERGGGEGGGGGGGGQDDEVWWAYTDEEIEEAGSERPSLFDSRARVMGRGAGTTQEPVSEQQMSQLYGPGLKLLQGMGYSGPGRGCGRKGQGLAEPVDALSGARLGREMH